MTKSSLDEFIAKSRIFQLVDPEGRNRLARVGTDVTFKANEVIMREGEPGDAFYAIISGSVSVDADDPFSENVKKHIADLSAGTVVGEIAALTREPRTATVIAKTDVRALRFEMVSVFGVLKDYPQALAELNRLGVTRSEDLLEKMS